MLQDIKLRSGEVVEYGNDHMTWYFNFYSSLEMFNRGMCLCQNRCEGVTVRRVKVTIEEDCTSVVLCCNYFGEFLSVIFINLHETLNLLHKWTLCDWYNWRLWMLWCLKWSSNHVTTLYCTVFSLKGLYQSAPNIKNSTVSLFYGQLISYLSSSFIIRMTINQTYHPAF